MQQRAFLDGVRARANREGSAFLKAITTDPNSIMRTPGADLAATAIRQSLKASAARITRVSEELKRVSAAGLAQNQKTFEKNTSVTSRAKQIANAPLSHHTPNRAYGTLSPEPNNLGAQGETIVISGGAAIVLILVIVAFKYIEYQV